MEIEKKPFKSGESLAIIIPKSLALYYEIDETTSIMIGDDEDKITIRKK